MNVKNRKVLDCADRIACLRMERRSLENELAQNTAALRRELNRAERLGRKRNGK